MTSAVPVHTYHPPRHPHTVAPTTPTPIPRSSTSTSVYTTSSSSTQNTTYWPNNGGSSLSTASSSSPRVNAGLAAAQYVTGRLHRRARSGNNTPDEIPDEMFDEGFFSGPGSPPPTEMFSKTMKPKNKIKPLLKKVSGSRGNSLDLSRSDGGLPNGVGLGIFDNPDSGVDEDVLDTAFPKYTRQRHSRNISGLSSTSANSPLIAGTNPTQPFAHPKRQVPRQRHSYTTPDLSRDATSTESSDGSEEDETETRRIVRTGSYVQDLKVRTSYESHTTPLATTSTITEIERPSSQLITPVTPVSPQDSIQEVKQRRGRASLKPKESKIREASPSFADSVTAARLAWEAKEEKKEEKREKKRRRMEAKEQERSASQNSHRARVNSGSSAYTWDEETAEGYREKTGMLEEEEEEDDDEVYTGRGSLDPPQNRNSLQSTRGRNATGKKWGVLNSDQNKPGSRKSGSLKKKWLGFIVWVRIGMVRLGRKMGF
ncbi:hypothetical protein FPQ18DRAFT_266056 [Pyronema domesticum]|uniref:Uncharacterized protein n=1 Tax=Pyronema omphalodes (strain CBS 100304) TaxID=1076935 RepID=U4L996_PYROM|nr:hypothetical protein FPQ18DRAFT_266056 [Pyronema domesticum]CCX06759.1 Similar to hypothetical protein [Tuber melanosporum Mel28]; acc. no. XP_002837058 [Pyronema omphalodes CBS 100304]